MNDTQVAWWFDRLGNFTGVIDRLNRDNDPVYIEACEQIRAIINNALAHGRENDATQEMEAIEVSS